MKFDRKLGDGDGPDSPGRLTENCTPPARLTKKRTLQPFSGCGVTKNRTLRAQCPSIWRPRLSPPYSLCSRLSLLVGCLSPASLAKGVVLKAPILVGAIAVDAVLGYAYAARIEDRDTRVRVPVGVRLEYPLVRVPVHKGCSRR